MSDKNNPSSPTKNLQSSMSTTKPIMVPSTNKEQPEAINTKFPRRLSTSFFGGGYSPTFSPTLTSPVFSNNNKLNNYSYFSNQQHKRAASFSASTSPFSPLASPQESSPISNAAAYDRHRLDRRFSDSHYDRKECVHHHHRCPKVAMKFKPNDNNNNNESNNNDGFPFSTSVGASPSGSFSQYQEDVFSSSPPPVPPNTETNPTPTKSLDTGYPMLNRPPTPIAEQILKGEFSF